MKLSRIVYPEVVLNRRGPEPVRQWIAEYCKKIKRVEIDGRPFYEVCGNELDEIGNHHFIFCKLFRESGGKTYYVPSEFARALADIDQALPIQYLPEKFFGWIQFGEGALVDDTGPVDGAFVYIGPAEFTGLCNEGKPYGPTEKIIDISAMNKPPQEGGIGVIFKYSVDLRSEKVSELSKEMPVIDVEDLKQFMTPGVDPVQSRNRVIRALLNAVLYLSSQDPEVMKLRPLEEMSHRARSEYRKTHPIDNCCTIPITVLNWSYKDEREYSVDETFVRTHPRWQRVGPERGEIKLIWVKGHVRRFKKDE